MKDLKLDFVNKKVINELIDKKELFAECKTDKEKKALEEAVRQNLFGVTE